MQWVYKQAAIGFIGDYAAEGKCIFKRSICLHSRVKGKVKFLFNKFGGNEGKAYICKDKIECVMTTLTLHIADQSIMPMLLNAIRSFKGVTVANAPAEHTAKIDGERWAREVLLPAYLDVKEMERKGIDLPDAHDFLKEMEELDRQELCK